MSLTIHDLPPEIFINLIFNYLNDFDLIILSRTDKRFNSLYHIIKNKIEIIYIDKDFKYLTSDEKDSQYFYNDNIIKKYSDGKLVETIKHKTYNGNRISYKINNNQIYRSSYFCYYENLSDSDKPLQIENTNEDEIIEFTDKEFITSRTYYSGNTEIKKFNIVDKSFVSTLFLDINSYYIENGIYLTLEKNKSYISYPDKTVLIKIPPRSYVSKTYKKYIMFVNDDNIIIYTLYTNKIITIKKTDENVFHRIRIFQNLFIFSDYMFSKSFVYSNEENSKLLYVLHLNILTYEKDKYIYIQKE